MGRNNSKSRKNARREGAMVIVGKSIAKLRSSLKQEEQIDPKKRTDSQDREIKMLKEQIKLAEKTLTNIKTNYEKDGGYGAY